MPAAEHHLCIRLAQCLAVDTGRLLVTEEKNRYSALLSEISTAELATLLLTFGAYCEISQTCRKPGGYKVAIMSDFVRVTAKMLEDWPSHFYSYMRETGIYGFPDAVSHEPPQHFLSFVRALRTKFNTPALEFVLKEYQKFMSENWRGVMDRRHSWAKEKNFNSQRYMSAASAAHALGISRNRIPILINQNILRGYIKRTVNHRDFVVVERDSLIDAEYLFSDHIPFTGAEILLGLPKGRIHELVNGGFLNPIIDETRRIPARLLSKKEIAAFVKRLSNGHREPVDEEDLLTAPIVLKTHLATGKEFIALISAIVAETISVVVMPSTKQGFARLSFRRIEFYRWRSAFRENATDIQLTVVEAAARLGIKQEVAYHLVRTGLLSSTISILGKKKTKLIRLANLEQFELTYISARDLAKSNGTSPKKIVENLRTRGVLPMTGPSIDCCRQYFFRKTQASAIEMNR